MDLATNGGTTRFIGERQPFEVLVRAFLETSFTTGNAEKAFGQLA